MTRLVDLSFFKRGFLFIILIVSTAIIFVPENLSTNIWKTAQVNFYTNIKNNKTNFDQSEFAIYEYLSENATIESNNSTILNETNIELCPLIPKNLNTRIIVKNRALDFKKIEKILKKLDIKLGGLSAPRECKSRHKVALIVPYRNREENLKIFLNNMHPFLAKQQIDYGIYLVEPIANVDFNRGLLMNIGFLESLKLSANKWDCFILHDVDLIPEDERNIYACSEEPRHMSSAVSTFNYKLPYDGIFGGVCALNRTHFEAINGFSNIFFGWGGEDDDLRARLIAKGFKISRYPLEIGRYLMTYHEKDLNINPKSNGQSNHNSNNIGSRNSNSIISQEAFGSTTSTIELLTEFKTESIDIQKAPLVQIKNPECYYTKGKSFLNLKNYPTAIYYFEKSIEKNDKCVEAYCGMGDCYYYNSDNEEATKAFEMAIKLDPSCAQAHNGLGLVRADKKDYRTAIKFYDLAIKLNSQNGEFYSNKGDSLDALEEGAKAIECFRKAVEIDSNDSDFQLQLGLALKKYQKEYEKSIECFDKAIRINPENSYAFFNKGQTLDHLNQGTEAIECFKKAISLNDRDQDFHFALGMAYKKYMQNFELALLCFEKSIEILPNQASFFFSKAEVLYAMEKYEDTIHNLNQAILLQPDSNGYFYFLKANALIDMHNSSKDDQNRSKYLEEAIECFEKAIELDSNDADYQINLGNAYYANNNMRKAANCFKRAIEINPRKADAHNGLGQVFNDKKGLKADYNSAIQYYNRAIELEPKNPCYHRNKGVTYFCTKQYSAAVLCFDEAIRLNPNECELYFIKGNAHKELKQFSEAQICYKKALELKPNEDYKKKIGKSLAIVKGKLENNHSPNKNENQPHSTSDDELGIKSEKIKYHNGNKRIKLT